MNVVKSLQKVTPVAIFLVFQYSHRKRYAERQCQYRCHRISCTDIILSFLTNLMFYVLFSLNKLCTIHCASLPVLWNGLLFWRESIFRKNISFKFVGFFPGYPIVTLTMTLKVKWGQIRFLNGNPYFLWWIRKGRKMLRSL